MTEQQRATLSLSRPLSPRRRADLHLMSKPVREDLLIETKLSNRRINGAIAECCRLAHAFEGGGALRRNEFDILYLADRLYGSRQDERPKLGKYLHVRRLLLERWWHKETVRRVIERWDCELLAGKQNPAKAGL